jgi:ankyrin repeat protein
MKGDKVTVKSSKSDSPTLAESKGLKEHLSTIKKQISEESNKKAAFYATNSKSSKAGATALPESDTKKEKNSSGSSSSDHTDRDGIKWSSRQERREVREVKNVHDSVVHKIVMTDDPEKLRNLLEKGLRASKRSIDGATPLHRAAEIGSIRCAEVLLNFNVDINAENSLGQTSYHVAGINNQVGFGSFLKTRGAKISCRQ